MKSEQVLAAFRAFLGGRQDEAIGYLRQIEATEQRAGNVNVASRVRRMIASPAQMIQLPGAPPSIHVSQPGRTLDSLILGAGVRECVDNIIREWAGRDRLAEHGLSPRNVILLHGPSGNGKTALAGAMANAVNLPFALASYAQLIDSHLGVTTQNLSKIFEFVNRVPCILMFDEADSLLAARSGGANSGADKEANRTVNAMLIELDQLSPSTLVIFATNMRRELDPALARRVCAELELGPPHNGEREAMVRLLADKWPFIRGGAWERDAEHAGSFAAIETLALDAARTHVLSGGTPAAEARGLAYAEAEPRVVGEALN